MLNALPYSSDSRAKSNPTIKSKREKERTWAYYGLGLYFTGKASLEIIQSEQSNVGRESHIISSLNPKPKPRLSRAGEVVSSIIVDPMANDGILSYHSLPITQTDNFVPFRFARSQHVCDNGEREPLHRYRRPLFYVIQSRRSDRHPCFCRVPSLRAKETDTRFQSPLQRAHLLFPLKLELQSKICCSNFRSTRQQTEGE